MALKDILGLLRGQRKKSIVDELREGETVMVQRRNRRLVFRKVEVRNDDGRTADLAQKRRRWLTRTTQLPPIIKVVRLPRPEDLIYKVSSGR